MTNADFDAVKSRLKATWMAGDFGQIADFQQSHAEMFINRRRIKPGVRALDVACGTGNLAIPAAKAGALVTGVDIATNLLEQARARALHEGVKIQFDEGDAQELVYPDATFDLVLSMYGVIFAPQPERAAAELIRVCRPGGLIGLANWTPRGFIGQMFKLIASYVPPAPGVAAPALWGDEAIVRDLLRDGISHLQLTPILAHIKYPFSVSGTVEFHRTYLGPVQSAFAVLPKEKQSELRHDLESLYAQYNQASDGTTYVETEYLEVVATRT